MGATQELQQPQIREGGRLQQFLVRTGILVDTEDPKKSTYRTIKALAKDVRRSQKGHIWERMPIIEGLQHNADPLFEGTELTPEAQAAVDRYSARRPVRGDQLRRFLSEHRRRKVEAEQLPTKQKQPGSLVPDQSGQRAPFVMESWDPRTGERITVESPTFDGMLVGLQHVIADAQGRPNSLPKIPEAKVNEAPRAIGLNRH